MQKTINRLKDFRFSFSDNKFTFVFFLLILLFFSFNDLVVRIIDISYSDETLYIMFGQELAEGIMSPFSWSPFTSMFFALLYLPFKSTVNWLPLVATLGRIIIYILLFLSLYLIAQETNEISWSGAVFGVALVYPAMVSILSFQSDALFAACSAFSLWQILQYRKTKAEKNIWLASAFSGLAALTRNDGLILYVAFLFIIIFVIQNRDISFIRKITASLIPFTVIVFGYLLIYGAVTGSFDMGTKKRAWGAFRQGQWFVYGNDENCQTNQLRCAIERNQELYGTGDENNYSIFNAIKSNPQAYTDRLITSLKSIPNMIFRAYGGRTSFSLLLLSLLGIVKLAQARNKDTLIIFISWMLYLPVYLLTFYRPGYFFLPYYVFYILALIGFFHLLHLFQSQKNRIALSIFFIALFFSGVILKTDSIYFTSFILLTSLWAGYSIPVFEHKQEQFSSQIIPALLILIGTIFLRGDFQPMSISLQPQKPVAEEEAIMLLFNEYPRDSQVIAGAPGAVISAHMQFISAIELNAEAKTPEEFYDMIVRSGVEAIYVDHTLIKSNETIWNLIEPKIGNLYERIYQGDQGSIQILDVKSD